MLRTLYTLLLCLLLPVIVLRLLWRSKGNADYRKRIGERFARVPKRQSEKPCIWVHAVSVGEVIACVPLVKELQVRYPDTDICITTTTPTGSERVRAAFGNSVFHYYLPYDLPSFNRYFIRQINPQMLLIMETELWPNLLQQCQGLGITTVLANARLSNKSAKRYAKLYYLSKPMFAALDFVAAQSNADAKRMVLLGAKPENVFVTGSIKFDINIDIEQLQKRDKLVDDLQLGDRKVAIFASTHPGEDELLMPIAKRLNQLDENFLALVVPRHLERFEPVYQLCQRHHLRVKKISEGGPVGDAQILLGDTIGDMLTFYGVANIAVIGGTFILHGGHNFLEAAAWQLPILSGKSVYNFQNIAHQLQKAGALKVVQDHYALERVLESWLEDDAAFLAMGLHAKEVFNANQGALDKLLTLVCPKID